MTRSAPAAVRPGFLTVVAVHLMFLPGGATQALYGPSLSAIGDRFAVSVGVAGSLIGVHSVGAIVGVLSFVALERALGLRVLCAVAGATLGGGAVLLGSAPGWSLMVGGAAVAGAGYGVTLTALNVYVARLLGVRSAPLLTSMAAVFGIGAILGPAALSSLGPVRHGTVFVWTGLLALVASPLMLRSASPPPATEKDGRRWRPSPLGLLFIVAFGLYVAMEVSTSGWAATHLSAGGMSAATAAAWTAAFWVAFTLGRLLATPIAVRVRPRTVVVVCMVGSTAALAATVTPLAHLAYVAAGLMFGPVFSNLYAWYTNVTGTGTAGSALFFLAGSAGAAVVPPLIGVMADLAGPETIPFGLVLVAASVTVLTVRLRVHTRVIV